MLAREVDGTLTHSLVTREEGVLAGEPAGVAAMQIRVAGRIAQGGPAGVVGADAGKDLL